MPKQTQSHKLLGLEPQYFLYLLGLLIFLPTVFNGYNLDDNLVTQNHRLTSKGIRGIYEIIVSPYFNESIGSYEYRPVTLITFALEHQLFGENPFISHTINLILFVGCIISTWLFLSLINPNNTTLNFFTILLFIIHPIHTEVLSSIKNRDELLSFLFGMTALTYFLKNWMTNHLKIDFIFAFFFLLLCLMSKRSFTPIIGCFLIWGAFFVQKHNPKAYWIFTVPTIIIISIFSPAWLMYQQILFISITLIILSLFSFSNLVDSNYLYDVYKSIRLKKIISSLKLIKIGQTYKFIIVFILFTTILCISLISAIKFNDSLFRAKLFVILLPMLILIIYKENKYIIISICGLLSAYVYQEHVLFIFATAFFALCHIRKIVYHVLIYVIVFVLILLNINSIYTTDINQLIIISTVMFLYTNLIINPNKNHIWNKVVYLLSIILLIIVILFAITDFHSPFDSITAIFFLSAVTYTFKTNRILTNRIKNISITGSILVILFSIINYGFIKKIELSRSTQTVLSNIEIKIGLISNTSIFRFIIPMNFPEGHYTKKLMGKYIERTSIELDVVAQALSKRTNLLLTTPSITPVAETNRELTFVENPLGNTPPLSKRIAYGMGTIGYYVRLLLIPYPLSAYYGYDTVPDFGWQTSYTYLGLLVVLLLFGLIAYSGWEKNSLGWLFGWWALLGLIAVSNLLFPIAGIIAERLVFGTSLAFCFGLAWLFVRVLKLDSLEDLVKRLKSPTPGILLLLGILLVWQVLNIQRIRQWKDPITLFTADLEHFPRSSQGHQLLANRLKDAAEKSNNPEEQLKLYAQAFSHYRQSAEIWPDYRESQLQAGNLSLLFQQPQQAKERFLKVLALGPGSGQLYFNLGNAYEQLNQPDSAILAYKTAIRLQPDVVTYYTNLSYLYFKQQKIDSSLQVNRRAIKYIPGTIEPLINMGKTFYQIQNWDSAIVYLERAYPLGKQDRNLVQVLAELHSRLGNFEKARFYREQLAPQLPSPNSIQQR